MRGLLDGRVVQARVRRLRGRAGRGARHPARGPVRGAARGRRRRARWASLLQPYWMPGVRYPGPEAKGAILGFGDVHGRAHVYRAILEGLAYALREGAERTVRRSKVPIRELRDLRRRLAVARRRTAVRRRLRAARVAAAHPRGGRARRRDRRRARARHPSPTRSTPSRRWSAIDRPLRARRRGRAASTRTSTARSTCRCTTGCKPLYREIRRITGYPPADRRAGALSVALGADLLAHEPDIGQREAADRQGEQDHDVGPDEQEALVDRERRIREEALGLQDLARPSAARDVVATSG